MSPHVLCQLARYLRQQGFGKVFWEGLRMGQERRGEGQERRGEGRGRREEGRGMSCT